VSKKKKYISILLLFFLIVGFIVINYLLPYAILQPPRIGKTGLAEKLQLDYEDLDVKSVDLISLKGYAVKSSTDTTRGVIILIHGIGGCKEHFLGLSKELATMDLESWIFDLRAHGQSEGEFCTYGQMEKYDLKKIVDLIKTIHPELPIGIWGNSLGGAVAIQGLELDPRIEFGIIESTFTDLHQIVYDYKKRILKGIGIRSLSDYVLGRAGKIASFEPKKIKPLVSVKNINQPIFIAHGEADKNIKWEYGKQLYTHLKSPDKQFYSIPRGEHFGLLSTGGTTYKTALIDFINRNLD
jgi:alpha-beta hydrolase superfamily lysophospholipase